MFLVFVLINPQLSFYVDDDAISTFSIVISLLKFYSFLFFYDSLCLVKKMSAENA